MPSQQCLRSHDGCDLSQNVPTQLLRLYGESATLVITEPQSVVVLSEHPIFFNQVINDVVLTLAHPSGNGRDEE